MKKTILFLMLTMMSTSQGSARLVTDSIPSDTVVVDSVKVKDTPQKKANKKDANKKDDEEKKEKSEYEKLLEKKGAVELTGLFTVRHIEDKYYFEVPDSMLGRLLLCVTRFTAVPQGFGQYGGEEITHNTVYFEQRDEKTLLMRQYVLSYLANDKDNIARTLEKATIDPMVLSFKVIGKNEKKDAQLVEVTSLFKGDNHLFSFPSSVKSTLKVSGLQSDRTFIDTMKVYPTNIEILTTRTYGSSPAASAASKTGSVTMGFNTSIVVLPKEPMRKRLWDERVGYFTNTFRQFSDDQVKAQHESFISRYKLVPKNKKKYLAGQLSEPVKPIVYYIDPATPKKWIPYLMQGIEDWNVAFEAAGLKNAIIAKEWPKDRPDMSLDDARFSVLRYLPSETENAYGPRIVDPRSGEIIEAHICWFHNVMNLLTKWYMVQCGPLDKRAQKMKFDDKLMGQLIRFVSSHEVGHTLGLRHNMGASYATPVEKLRDKQWVEAHGHTVSIMDYARFNYVAQPEDHISQEGIFPRINTYDKWAIEWGYKYFPEVTTPILYTDGEYVSEADQERLLLNKMTIAKLAESRRYWFGGEGQDNDPRAQTEDLGDDAMKASDYGIKNLKRIIGELPHWVREEGDLGTNLEQMYSSLIGQMRRYVGHVGRNIGGVYHNYKSVEEPGDVYVPEEKVRVQRAMKWLDEQVLTEPKWLIDVPYIQRLTSNPQSLIEPLAKQAISSLCSASTFNNVVCYSYSSNAYQPADYTNDLVRLLFSTPSPNRWRRYVQSQAVSVLISAWNSGTTVESRSYVTEALQLIQQRVRQAGGDPATRAHYKQLDLLIKLTFEK